MSFLVVSFTYTVAISAVSQIPLSVNPNRVTSANVALVDSMPTPASLLTSEVVGNYLILKAVLKRYWRMPEHISLRHVADSTELHPTFLAAGSSKYMARAYNYPMLVERDTSLSALFSRAHVVSGQYSEIHVAIWQAMMNLLANESDPQKYPLPGVGSVERQNVAIVKEHWSALEKCGVVPFIKEPGGTKLLIAIPLPYGVLALDWMDP